MKRSILSKTATALMIAMVACMSCKKDNDEPVRVSGVNLNQTSLTLEAGANATLTATVLPANAENKTVAWTSSNTSAVTVDNNGNLRAISAGTSDITVTTADGSKTAVCKVTVSSGNTSGTFVAVTGITGVPATAVANTSVSLTATVAPATATNQTIVWSVASAGTTGATITGSLFSATAAGTATVTATIAAGTSTTTAYTQNFTITVAPAGTNPGTGTYKFPGFENMTFATGKYWKYEWKYTNYDNYNHETSTNSGTFTITLGAKLTHTFSVGELDLYKATYTTTGDGPYNWIYQYEYLAVKDGVLYGTRTQNDGSTALYTIFSAKNGTAAGHSNFLVTSRIETASAKTIDNPYSSTYEGSGVEVMEVLDDDFCEIIAGEEICDDQSHNYEFKEYYLPGIGFAGFYRYGTSMYTGGGYNDSFTGTTNIWLVDTNMK
ncbi:MAG: Ig-like domain-containing protein [Bacteroidales bacterium]|nr:Ig-like domain-containing protein [Bacteroidales bacterium]